jgi:hypothetical protein
MTNAPRYRINTPSVTHDTIDGEVIMMNLANGNYYSLEQPGAEVWNQLSIGADVSAIVEALRPHYDNSRAEIATVVNELIGDLLNEGLIVPDGALNSRVAQVTPARAESETSMTRPLFHAPKLQKYTDMQELILLDPVHDSAETGWPQTRAPSSKEEQHVEHHSPAS